MKGTSNVRLGTGQKLTTVHKKKTQLPQLCFNRKTGHQRQERHAITEWKI